MTMFDFGPFRSLLDQSASKSGCRCGHCWAHGFILGAVFSDGSRHLPPFVEFRLNEIVTSGAHTLPVQVALTRMILPLSSTRLHHSQALYMASSHVIVAVREVKTLPGSSVRVNLLRGCLQSSLRAGSGANPFAELVDRNKKTRKSPFRQITLTVWVVAKDPRTGKSVRRREKQFNEFGVSPVQPGTPCRSARDSHGGYALLLNGFCSIVM